jgi:amino acid adenylation domain-containing protein
MDQPARYSPGGELFRSRQVIPLNSVKLLHDEKRMAAIPQNELLYYPLSAAQQGLLFHSLSLPEYNVYCGQNWGYLIGRLNLAAFTHSWEQLIARHAILRTEFQWQDRDDPVQIVHPRAVPVIDFFDWQGIDEEVRALEELRISDRRRGFDLRKPPLMRFTIVRLSPEKCFFLWSSHHLVLDGWSRDILMREFAAFYAANCRGQELELPAVKPYGDYIDWLQRQDGAAEQDFWKSQLAGYDAPIHLAVDSSPGSIAGGTDATETAHLTPQQTAIIQQFARANRLTMSVIVHAAWAMLISRYTGNRDVVFGTTVAGRPETLAGAEVMVGLFMNTLPLRLRIPRELRILSWLKHVQSAFLDVLQRQHTPLTAIRAWASVPADMPFFETVVAFQNYAGMSSELSLTQDIKLVGFQGSQPTNYPLLLRAAGGNALMLSMNYHRERFSQIAIQTMLAQLGHLLVDFAANPELMCGAVSGLTPEERNCILLDWNRTAAPFPEKCIHELIAEQAKLFPEAAAVRHEGLCVTYRELESKSNQLARYLLAHGIALGSLVAVFLERSPDVAVVLLGTLKAGAAFLPIDPTYPAERIALMLEDSNAQLILTQERLASKLPSQSQTVVCLDTYLEKIEEHVPSRIDVEVAPQSLLYVIYTSGSTGRPKGVMLDHIGRVNNFSDFNRRFRIGPGDALLSLSSLSFDMSAYDFLGTLLAGATVVLPASGGDKDPAAWAEAIRDGHVTIWHSAPALLEATVEYAEVSGSSLASLRLALLGGDWIPVQLPDRLKALSPRVEFISLGGATEVSMDSTIYAVQQTDAAWKSIPYGVPMTNQLAYVLSEDLLPTPVGVPGELHLGGKGVGWGYLRQPWQTAVKFIPNPFSDTPGTRLYKTGDVAMYGRDGVLVLLGRMDHQVKIRGLRIELGEIEAALRSHPGVQDCVVLAHQDKAGDRYLAAYVKRLRCMNPDSASMEAALRGKLPDYMVPHVYSVVDEFPLTPNGKLDRRRLQPPEFAARPHSSIPPVTASQKKVAARWCEVLGLSAIGIDDNFFELGGSSLKAMRACRIDGRYVPVVDLYKTPTVRAMAERLETGFLNDGERLHLLNIPDDPSAVSIICVPYGGGNAVVYKPLTDFVRKGIRVYALALPGRDFSRKEEVLLDLEAIARICAEEMQKISGPRILYGHCAGTVVALETARLLTEMGEGLHAIVLGAALPKSAETFFGPFSDPLENYSSSDIHQGLVRLGAFEELPPEEIEFVIRGVRHDVACVYDFYRRTYASTWNKLSCPIHCIVGGQDPQTQEYQTRYLEWTHFADQVTLHVIPEGGHYFLKHQAPALARILAEVAANLAPDNGI